MRSVVKYILFFNILIAALPAEAQFIDTACINTLGRGYHVFGLPGSTYTWTVPGGTPAPVSVHDTIFVNWGSVPGIYTITVMEHSIEGCDGKLVLGNVWLVNNPTVFAGNNTAICADSNATLSSSDSAYCTRILWTTSGNGTFSDATQLHPVYTPGPADIFAGSATLTLTGYGLGLSCPNAISTVVLTIIKPVIASAGPDVSACALTPFTITGATAANYGSLLWTDNGTGTLINATTISPTYIPAQGELGNVIFTLQANSILPCHETIVSQMVMTIHPVPAGTFVLLSKDTICGGDTVNMRLDLTGTPPWTFTYTDGDTTITVNNLLSTPYFITAFPDSTVTYALLSLNDAFCSAPTGILSSTIKVIVHPKPRVEYTWQNGPQNNEVQFHIDSSVTNLGAIGYMVVWNFGDGTFGYGHNPIHYYPGSTTFNCILTVTDTNGCQNSVMHTIYVPPLPIAFYSSTSPVCLGSPMCFQDLSTVPSPPGEYIQTWIWNFGDGTPADTIHFPNNPDVCHLYTTIGTYQVSLTIRDNLGVSATYTNAQVVNPDPTASFTYTMSCENQPVQFTDASTQNGGGAIITWNWNFGDPTSGIDNTSSLQNPVHTFTTGNNLFNVTLIIQNFNGCRDTVIQPVHILSKPPVDFTHDSACNGEVVHFAADTVITHVDSIVSWLWNFGDGSQPVTSPVTVTHTYTSTGIYLTTLTVTDHHGCINSVSHGIRVNPLPIAQFSWSSPACFGNPVQYTDNSTVPSGYTGYPAKWLWDFGDGTSQLVVLPASPNVTHTFVGQAMSHTVRLTVWTSDSCSQFIEHVVESTPSPIADFNFSTIHCKDQPVQFTDLSTTNGGGSIAQWSWQFGDPGSGISNTSTLQNPVHTYQNSGSYNVSLIVTNFSGCSDTIIKVVNINSLPLANFHTDTACLNNNTQFTNLSIPNGGVIINYTWDFGDGSADSHQQNPSHTYALSGTFNVTLAVVNSNGCQTDTIKPVLVNPLPVAAFVYTSPSCFGAVVQYTNLSTTPPGYFGSIVKWVWDFGDGTSVTILAPANPDVSHTFNGPALSHVVRLTVTTSDGCINYTEHTVNSIPSPVANFGYPSLNCTERSVPFIDLSQTNGGGTIISWKWNFGDPASGSNDNSTLQNPVHLFTDTGSYNVTLIIFNTSNCSDTVYKTVRISPAPVANFIADTVCLNHPTQFTDISIPDGGNIITYSWDFGDGSPLSGLQNPSHTYASYGIMNVKLTVTNSNGCTQDTTKQVMVRPLPSAEFSFSTMNCHGSPVQFTDQSTVVPGYMSSIVQWVWNFGDGTPPVTIVPPANPNVTHIFAGMASSYTVVLTVTTSDGCSSFIEHTVNIIASPLAGFTYPAGNCVLQPVHFTDNSQTNGGGNIIQWYWNFGDPSSGLNNQSALQNPSHTFNAAGTYTVTEIVYNSSNCPDTAIHTITVSASPVADFVADTACLGSATTFTDQSSTPSGQITQYLWNFGDGTTSNLKDPVHSYQAAGTFQVSLTVTIQAGCSNTITKPVLVLPRPVVAFSTSGPTCLGATVQFTDNSSAIYGSIHSWTWNFGDGVVTTIISPASPDISHLYTASGTYNVTLTVTTTNSCVGTATNPVTVQPAPTANFAYSSMRCEFSPVQFTDMTQDNGGPPVTQWLWKFDDPGSGIANISTLQNPVHNFTASGIHNVSLHVTSASGCVDSITRPVSIYAKPVAQFSSDTACAHSATQFIDHSIANASGILTWHWNFGDPSSGTNNTSSLQNPSHVYSSAGNYIVTLTVINTNLCEKDTLILLPIPPTPIAMFTFSSACAKIPTQFTDQSIAPNSQLVSWFWDFGDGVGTSNLQNPVYTYTNSGTYNVKLRVTNLSGCADSITIPVPSYPLPVAAFTYNSFFCPAGQVMFTDQSHGVGTDITERLWIFEPGSSSTLPDPTFIFPVTDTTYLVTLIVTDTRGCKDTTRDSVFVKPVFSFTFSQDTACYGNPTHFHAQNKTPGDSLYSLQWNFGDPNTGVDNFSTLRNPKHTFSSAGSFIVMLKAWDSDNCTDSVYKTTVVRTLPKPNYSYISPVCDTLMVFTDLSTPGSGGISSWTWNFGDGSPDKVILAPGPGSTTHVYALPGTYGVLLKVTNSLGCDDTVSHPVTKSFCISANFTQNATGACTNALVTFTDNSQPVNQIAGWHWIFGDGTDTVYTKSSVKIKHSFISPGIYNVRLIISTVVSGQTFTDTATSLVTIDQAPEAQFSTDPVCLDKITLFRDQTNTYGVDITTRKWVFGDPSSGNNNSSGLPNASHKYVRAGTYDVSLMVINKNGCKDSLSKQARVYTIPDAKFDNTLACSNNPTYFFDRSIVIDTSIEKWHWDFGVPDIKRDTSMLENPSYIYKKDGNYNVKLIVSDYHGCDDTVDSLITVHISPLSAFLVIDNVSGMTGKIQLQNKSEGADNYYWDFGNGSSSTEESPIVTYTNDGSYLITLVAANNFGCVDSTFLKYEVLFKGLYVPNAFVPESNIQGVNVFKPVGVDLKEYKVEVFDPWGQLLWESSLLDSNGRPVEGWNGRKQNGAIYQSGTYVWKISAVFIDGTTWEGSNVGKGEGKTIGTVTLIR